VQSPENSLIEILKKNSFDFVCTLPCEKIKGLLEQIKKDFFHIPLTREELPLAIFVSQRGIYKETIPAQMPMGQRLPGILKGGGISYSIISTTQDIHVVEQKLPDVYRKNKIHAFLLSPAVFKGICDTETPASLACPVRAREGEEDSNMLNPRYTRFEILKIAAPYLESRVVVCNLGMPSKELFKIKHQPSNFYMLGSMGMATPIGLGISLASDKEVVVIDGDGSILMNPGSLATAAHFSPPNLTILAVDNSSYGSTGGQLTLTGSCVDLTLLAKGFGIRNVFKVAEKKQIVHALKMPGKEVKFIHALALPGNAKVSNITVHYLEVKKQVMEFLGE
jgi:sulfopyruvate decarboxylase subunit beta